MVLGMKTKIQPCDTVGNAFQVVQVSKFGAIKKLAIGLTKFEAICAVKRLKNK